MTQAEYPMLNFEHAVLLVLAIHVGPERYNLMRSLDETSSVACRARERSNYVGRSI